VVVEGEGRFNQSVSKGIYQLKGMIELAKESKERFLHGIVFYGGDEILPIAIDDYLFYCIPLGVLG